MPTTTTPDLEDALTVVRIALGLGDEDQYALDPNDIPTDAVFGLRRDVEYFATDGHVNGSKYDGTGNLAAPRDDYPVDWTRTSETDDDEGNDETGEWEPLESDWAGSDVLVYPFRWDARVVGLEGLAHGLNSLDAYAEGFEQLAGYLDADSDNIPRLFPAASYLGDGMDWNMGGVTPVFIYADYVILY